MKTPNWKSTSDLRLAAESVYQQLTSGEIDADKAKSLGAQIRTAAKLVSVELEAAKMRGIEKFDSLPALKLE